MCLLGGLTMDEEIKDLISIKKRLEELKEDVEKQDNVFLRDVPALIRASLEKVNFALNESGFE